MLCIVAVCSWTADAAHLWWSHLLKRWRRIREQASSCVTGSTGCLAFSSCEQNGLVVSVVCSSLSQASCNSDARRAKMKGGCTHERKPGFHG